MIDLLTQSMTPLLAVIQSIPRITSNPCDGSTIKRVGNLYTPISKVRSQHLALTNISPPGELTLIDLPIVSVGSLFLFTNVLDMNECDAPVSNQTNAVNEFSGNIPITSTSRWFTCPFLNGLGLEATLVDLSGHLSA